MKTKVSNKYVTFDLGNTKFGIAVLKTREIVVYGKITPIPEAPEYIQGVINLRGSVVPVVDLTKKFFGNDTIPTEKTGIMIVEINLENEIILIGLIVDSVKDVMEIKDENLEPPPKYGAKLKSEYLLNMAPFEDNFILILDIDKVLSNIEFNQELSTIIETKKLENNNILVKNENKPG